MTSLEPDKSRGYACKCIIYTKCNLPQEKFKADIHKNLVYHASDHGESEEILGEFLNNKEIDRIFNTELRTSIYKQYPIHEKTSWGDLLVEFWFIIFLIIILILIYLNKF